MVASVSGENNVLIYGSMMNTESNNSIIENQKPAQPKEDPNKNPEAIGSSTNLPTTSTVVGNSKTATSSNQNKEDDTNSPTQYTVDDSSQKDIIKNYSQIVQQNIEASGSQPQQTNDGTTTTYSDTEQLEGYNKFFDNKIKETYANNSAKEPVSFFTLSA